jgi:hypothetical protein
MKLEPAIASYFSSSNARDREAFAASFAPDAVVLDEGAEVQGAEAVLGWFARTVEAYDFHLEPKEVFGQGDRQAVKTYVTGPFPGSPIDLVYVFDLRDGRIARLETMDDLPANL